jgi:Uma2 family endonuclease
MATRAFSPPYRPTTVAEFLEIDLGEVKAELVDGQILMMPGGSAKHAEVAANLISAPRTRLRGTGCRPSGSDMALRTGEASVRFPDISVYCRANSEPFDPTGKLIGVPKVVFEVLSPSTASNDQIVKLAEYRALPGLDAIVFIDPTNERNRVVDPTTEVEADWLVSGSDLALPSLDLIVQHDEIFADD